MKRLLPIAVLILLVSALVAPSAGAATSYTFAGKSSARALDLGIPALNVNPQLAQQFKGLTVGATFAEFNSTPSILGRAAGRCELLPSNAGTSGPLACTSASSEDSSAPGTSGDGQNKCEAPVNLAGVVGLNASCANSFSSIDSGSLKGDNSAGVADLKLSLDLSQIPVAGGQAESAKDTVVDALAGVVNTVFVQTKQTPIPADKQEALKQALNDFLASVKQGGQFGVIKAGLSSTQVVPTPNGFNVSSQAAGSTIALLGQQNVLQDGLVIIEVSVAKVGINWNSAAALATGWATPAVATIKVKDIANLDAANDYLVASVTVPQLNTLLAPLSGTLLETTLTAADSSVSPPGLNVSAATSGVSLHAVKGLGETSAGARNGGVVLRLAVANASFSAAPVEQAPPPLPTTGGPIYAFLGAAVILAAGAPFVWRLSRRLHKTV